MLSIVKEHYALNDEEQRQQDENFNNSTQDELDKAKIDLTQLSTFPLGEEDESWDLTENGDLFREDITKEEFLFECDFLTQFNNLLSVAGEDTEILDYLNNIQEIGAQNFFDALDSDMNGILDIDVNFQKELVWGAGDILRQIENGYFQGTCQNKILFVLKSIFISE